MEGPPESPTNRLYSICSRVTGRVVAWPSTTIARESPTSTTSAPASCTREAERLSQAVNTVIARPDCLKRISSAGRIRLQACGGSLLALRPTRTHAVQTPKPGQDRKGAATRMLWAGGLRVTQLRRQQPRLRQKAVQ